MFFRSELTADRLLLDGPEGRHAATVKRLRAGEQLDLVDGQGVRCRCAVVAVGRDTVTLDVLARTTEPAGTPRITLVQALAKGDRGELAVELATEVGVDEIIPWAASRCVQQWDGERGAKSLERWRSTARAAAKQSRRAWWPVVRDPVLIQGVVTLPGQLLVLHESAGVGLSEVELSGDVVLVVGPEGGLTPEELDAFRAVGAQVVRLGPTVLRTSTAGAAATAVVSSRTGRW